MTKYRNCSGKRVTNSPRALYVRGHAQSRGTRVLLTDRLTFRARHRINKIEKTVPMMLPAAIDLLFPSHEFFASHFCDKYTGSNLAHEIMNKREEKAIN